MLERAYEDSSCDEIRGSSLLLGRREKVLGDLEHNLPAVCYGRWALICSFDLCAGNAEFGAVVEVELHFGVDVRHNRR